MATPQHYRPAAGISHRSPNAHHQPSRRGPGPLVQPAPGSIPPPHLNPAAQAQLHQQQLEIMKRRARKPFDKTMPDNLESFIPNVGDYRAAREVDKLFDTTVMRKRLDIQDAVNRNVKMSRTLRIWISNTVKDQPWQNSDRPLDENAFDFDSGQVPTFRVRIAAQLLEDENGEEKMDEDVAPPPQRKFSSFFKSIVIELARDNNLYPEGNTIEWRRPMPPPPQPPHMQVAPPPSIQEFDAIEFERKGDMNVDCVIRLERNESPERYRLSDDLAQLLDTKEDTRAGIVMGLWEYVRSRGLQDTNERRTIHCDAPLKKIFAKDRLHFPQIPELIVKHLQPLEPIKLQYKIHVEKESHNAPYCYDIAVPIDDPIRAKMTSVLQSQQYQMNIRELLHLDDQISAIVNGVSHSKTKRDFFLALARDPKGFLDRWIVSATRDREVLEGEPASADAEAMRRADFYEKTSIEYIQPMLNRIPSLAPPPLQQQGYMPAPPQ